MSYRRATISDFRPVSRTAPSRPVRIGGVSRVSVVEGAGPVCICCCCSALRRRLQSLGARWVQKQLLFQRRRQPSTFSHTLRVVWEQCAERSRVETGVPLGTTGSTTIISLLQSWRMEMEPALMQLHFTSGQRAVLAACQRRLCSEALAAPSALSAPLGYLLGRRGGCRRGYSGGQRGAQQHCRRRDSRRQQSD